MFVYQNTQFAIPLIGGYNIMNALAAISAGILLHIDLKKVAKALQTFDLTKIAQKGLSQLAVSF